MTTEEPMLTQAEQTAAEALRIALHEIAGAWPVRVDAGALSAHTSARRRSFGGRSPLGLAAALAVALIGATAVVAWPRDGAAGTVPSPSRVPTEVPTEGPTLPGTPGHFDNGQFSFDYPNSWSTLGGGVASTTVEYVLAVLGTGTWRENCQSGADGSSSWMNCGSDIVEVPAGGIVVKVYLWYGGPFVPCRGDTQANATLGQYAVRKTVEGDLTRWEMRPPGNEFGQPNNIFVEAHTGDPNQLARAEGVVRSFRWKTSDQGPGMGCESPSAVISTTAP